MDAEPKFFSFKHLSMIWSRRGWNTSVDPDTLLTSISAESPSPFSSMVTGGMFGWLSEISGKLTNILHAVESVGRGIDRAAARRSESEAAPGRDFVADGRLLWLTGGLRGCETIEVKIMSVRARKAVSKSGCKTALELALFGNARITSLRNSGVSTAEEIRKYLKDRHGLELDP